MILQASECLPNLATAKTPDPVLGLPHLAVHTRDVALYQPFRLALGMPNQIIGLQTLMWRLMVRQVQSEIVDPVSGWILMNFGPC